MKKLVVIASRFPYPIEKGDKLRLYHQIKSLAKAFDIYLLALTDIKVDDADKKALSAYCKQIHLFPISGKKNTLKALYTRMPFQVAYFYDKSVHRMMEKLVNYIQPDHIYSQLIRTMHYTFDINVPKTIDVMDCFSKGYLLRAKAESGFMSLLYKIEGKRLRKAESELVGKFDNQTIISRQDAESLIKDQFYHVVPNGIDTDYFNADDSVDPIHDVLFVGNMGYEPNIYAVEYMHNEIFPLVQKLKPQTKFYIAGARPVERIKKLNADLFEIAGWVEDIRQAYNQSKLFVAPIFGGIGQQNKVLEAMAMNKPCIISGVVAKGLDIPNIETMVTIADTAEAFSEAIVDYLNGSEIYNAKQATALKYLREARSWEGVNGKLIELIS